MPQQVSICFVCLGNICRSPTAEGVMRHLVEREGHSALVRISSAGTAAYHIGELPDPRSRAHALRRGYRLASRARKFEVQDFADFDYVLAMDRENLAVLERLRAEAPTLRGTLGLFRDFDELAPPGSSVPDPYYGGDAGFEEVLDQCERAARGLLATVLGTVLGEKKRPGTE